MSSFLAEKNANELLTTCRSIKIILSLAPCITIKSDNSSEEDFVPYVSALWSKSLEMNWVLIFQKICLYCFHIQKNRLSVTFKTAPMSVLLLWLRNCKQSKKAVINCASAAYPATYLGLSHSVYKYFVTEIHSSGLKSHSINLVETS